MSIKWEKRNTNYPWSSCNVRQDQRNPKAPGQKNLLTSDSVGKTQLCSSSDPLPLQLSSAYSCCCGTYISSGRDNEEKWKGNTLQEQKLWSRKSCSPKDRISLVIQVCFIPGIKVNWDYKNKRQLWWVNNQWQSSKPIQRIRSKTTIQKQGVSMRQTVTHAENR